MRLDPFKLERYLAKYEFTAPHQLSCSDCDGLALSELLALADGESKQLWESLSLGYTEAPGHPVLRAEIAGLYSGMGADDVLVAAPEELVFLAINSLIRNGDHIVCTFPAYQSLYQVAMGMHCEVSFWEPDEKSGWRFDPARLADLIRPSTRLIVVNFPHNPTGALPSRDDFDAVVDVARRHNLALLSDEMYRQLELDESRRLPAAAEVYERAVSLSGMSKVYGLAGARIGWVVSRDSRLLRRMLALKDYTTICNSAPSEVLSLMALRAGEQIVARHVARIRRNLAVLGAFIDTYPSLFAWNPPVAGTVCLPRVVPETLRAEKLCDEAVEEAGVVLVPSSMFDYGDRHVRFGLGRETFPEALAAFDAFLSSKLSGAPPATPGRAPAAVAEPTPVAPAPEPTPVAPAPEPASVAPPQPPEPDPEPAPAGPGPEATPPPTLDAAPVDDALAEFAVEIAPPSAEDGTDMFPPSSRDAHPEPEVIVVAPEVPVEPYESGFETDPTAPALPEGTERGQGMPMEFFDDPEDGAGDQAEDPDGTVVQVVSPGDIAPEAVFAAPSADSDSEGDSEGDPEPAPGEPTEVDEARPASGSAPPGSWDTISPPPGSWGAIPPPDGKPGT